MVEALDGQGGMPGGLDGINVGADGENLVERLLTKILPLPTNKSGQKTDSET